MNNKRNWLEIVEYISIAGSIVGSIVAVISQQMIYAATPISLSLVLNLLNRKRWENGWQQGGADEIIEIEKQISRNVEALREQILALPNQRDLGGMQAALERMGRGLAQVESEIAIQTRELGSVQANFQNLASSLKDLSEIQAQIEQLSQRIEERAPTLALQEPADLKSVQRQIDELRQALGSLSKGIANLEREAQNLVSRKELGFLTSEIEKIQRQQKIIEQSVTPIAGELGRLSERIADVRIHLNALREELNKQPPNSVEQMAELRDALAKIQQQFEELPNPSQQKDLGGVEAGLKKLAEEIAALRAEVETRLDEIKTNELYPMRGEIAQLQTQLASLQASFQRLSDRFLNQTREPIPPSQPTESKIQTKEPSSVSPLWRCIHTLRGHSSAVTCLCISPDGKKLASGSYQEIKLWNLETAEAIKTLEVKSEAMAVSSLAIAPSGDILACANGNVEIWHLESGELIRTIETSSWASSIAISLDGRILVSTGEDPVDETGSLQIWNLVTGELLWEFEEASNCVAISPDGQILASGGKQVDEIEDFEETGLIQVRHLDTGEILYSLTEHSGKVYSVAISPDGQILASGSQERTVKLWNLKTGKLLRTLTGHSLTVHSVAISPDGKFLASGSADKTIRVWNLNAGELIQTLGEHSEKVAVVAFSPQENVLVSGSQDETIKIWRQC
ncbi:MAG: hypothetical protein N3E45_00455 [Oscillatoriaceae bacterium SKW80]|nr:hypothetical protein [Oscillatoriaceae bacterium SKYG93]MCX8119299.1 hypothetical protein [Oscillatoriaceae bacterium SKW80]MDW8454766.1 hypothetical protein [Oscillatoriaceae cyanobacterium SKYGB_i_bin93]HIK28453.1 hypothetical protein [Oscillatoriaceae cyanobacterium M7585_C2015_266]